jgi:hypothetical protein
MRPVRGGVPLTCTAAPRISRIFRLNRCIHSARWAGVRHRLPDGRLIRIAPASRSSRRVAREKFFIVRFGSDGPPTAEARGNP